MPFDGRPIEQRFWDRVTKTDDCWLWTGNTNKVSGYGRIQENTKCMYTHRYSWTLHHGEIPEGLWVLHKCDTPSCVRPDHLFLGTPKVNVQDMMSKGRARVGNAVGTVNSRKSKCGFKGVKETKNHKWEARITMFGKTVTIGTFSTLGAAARAYDDVAFVLHGRKAILNFPERYPCG